jgi:hypothetical protein
MPKTVRVTFDVELPDDDTADERRQGLEDFINNGLHVAAAAFGGSVAKKAAAKEVKK